MLARKIKRPPVRSAYDRIKGGCDCKDCAPSSQLGKVITWLDRSPGGWSTLICLAALAVVALGYYYFWPATDIQPVAAIRG